MPFAYSFWTSTPYSLSTSGLLALWNFNDQTQLGLDLINSINLSANGSIFATQSGKFGSGLEVPNSFVNNYMSVTDNRLNLSGNRTFAFWVKPHDTFNTNWMVWKGNPTLEYYFTIGKTSDTFLNVVSFGINTVFGLFGVATNTGFFGQSGATSIQNDQWNLIVGWYDRSVSGSGAFLQVNNGLVYKTQPLFQPVTGSSPFGVGNYSDNIAQTDDYYIDEVSIWNRVLTAPERAAIWNNGNGKPYPYV
jgi:hypothetical protein